MSRKFIPNGDRDLSTKAQAFARAVADDPAGVGVSLADSEVLSAKASEFAARLQEARWGDVRGPSATRRKEEARRELEKIMRRLGNQLRGNDSLDDATRIRLGLPGRRTAAPRAGALPIEPPRLKFVRAIHESNGATPLHELRFSEMRSWSRARPAGAARLELFVDLVPPDEPIPKHPGANLGGRPWYLRSYTRNPIILTPPLARVPMRIVYWARWADTAGNVGPFSATAAGWVEGGSHLPALAPLYHGVRPALLEPTAAAASGGEGMILVAVLEAQYQSLHPTAITTATPAATEQPALPGEQSPPRQLEGPAPDRAELREAA